MKKRVKNLAVIILIVGVNLSYSMAAAQTYPTKPVRLLVGFAAGGSTDIFTRVIAAQLSERLGQQVIVENVPGAAGIISYEKVAKAKPDGYTLQCIGATFAIVAATYKTLPYHSVNDFVPVTFLGSWPYVLTTHPSLPVNSIKDLIALAKKKPGEISFAAAGVGTVTHLSAELFRLSAGIDVMIVQFKGGGPAMIDVLGGHTNAAVLGITQCLPHIQAGKLKASGITGPKRSDSLPGVPTIAEAAIPGYETCNWLGILAPAGTPKPIVDKLNTELMKAVNSDKTKELFVGEGGEVSPLGPAEFKSYLAAELGKWSRVVKEAGIKPQ